MRIGLRKDAPPQEVQSDVENVTEQRSAVTPQSLVTVSSSASSDFNLQTWSPVLTAKGGSSSPSFQDSRENLDGTLAHEGPESKGASGA